MLSSHFLGVVLTASLSSSAFVTVARAQLDPGVNQQDGALLCRVYQIANRKIEEFKRPPEVETYVGEIDVVNISLADGGWVQMVETDGTEAGNHNEGTGATTAASSELRSRWRKAIEAIKQRSANKREQVTLRPAVRAKASKKLRLIEQEVDTLLESINSFSPKTQIQHVNQLFQQAIYGEGATKGDETTGWNSKASGRAADCGTQRLARKGTLAGDSIGLDFHCLCVPKTSTNLQNACGVDLGDGGANNWAAGAVTDGSGTMWKALMKYCSTYPHPNSTAAARTTLQEFLARLAGGGRTGIANVKTKHGLLGATAEDADTIGCDGDKGTGAGNGICVYYGSENWGTTIKWFQKITQALGELETIEEGKQKLQQDIAELKHLKTRAEEIYEEAKVDSESEQGDTEKATQNQNERQDPSSPTGKVTSQDPTAVSTASIHSFILPWTLLI